MNLEYLKAFYITVKSNSISKAARALHMSQPGVSIQLQALEKELNTKLLDRSNKGVQLTDAGKLVYDYAVSILSIQENVEHQLKSLKKNKTELIISSCTTLGSYSLPFSLLTFKDKFPQVHILLDISNSTTVIDNIINENAKLGIIEGDFKNKEIVKIKINSNNLKLVVRPDFHFNKVTLAQFLELPLILRENGSGTRACLSSILAKRKINITKTNVIMELNSTEAIKSAVMEGKGIAILPELAIKNELATGELKEIKIEDLDLQADFHLIYLKNSSLSEVENELANFISSIQPFN